MIYICDLCGEPDSLSYYEYVKPIEEIVKSFGREFKTIHYTALSKNKPEKNDSFILCGTALMDNKFLEDSDKFRFIMDTEISVLGVCAGVQVIAKIFGGNISLNRKIGMTKVIKTEDDPLFEGKSEFEAYELHNNSFDAPDDFIILARSESGVQAIKHKKRVIYGVVFHPEVRNEWVVCNFLKIYGTV
ncbi:MAG: gamma-glutamyl-gamma-aminobutyrate hydrolase family protein [Methanomicrobiaceae archaeon]|nr:gamma-glutamyl-gamma-aminobutyrate hydrolase family protein [Methanomicrobiaceae archaeon]